MIGNLLERHVAPTTRYVDIYGGAPGSLPRYDTNQITTEPESASLLRAKSLYYSELGLPLRFEERFISVEFLRSQVAVAVNSVGDTLIVHGDSDAWLLRGQTEANFQAQPLSIPGTRGQATTLVVDGQYYFANDEGFYALDGANPVNLALPIIKRWRNFAASPSLEHFRLSASRRFGLIYIQTNNDNEAAEVMVYDARNKAWWRDTQSTTRAGRLFDVGEYALRATTAVNESGSYEIQHFKGAARTAQGRIEYRAIDAGNYTNRKRVNAVHIEVLHEGGGVTAPLVGIGLQDVNGVSDIQPQSPEPGYRQLMRRMAGLHLTSGTLTFALSPNGNRVQLIPSIRLKLEVQDEVQSGSR
jgi:hypothetical protein